MQTETSIGEKLSQKKAKSKGMVKAYSYGMMDEDMKVNMKMILSMVMVHFSGIYNLYILPYRPD